MHKDEIAAFIAKGRQIDPNDLWRNYEDLCRCGHDTDSHDENTDYEHYEPCSKCDCRHFRYSKRHTYGIRVVQ